MIRPPSASRCWPRRPLSDSAHLASRLLPVLAGALPLALYFFTACRDIFWVDSTEFMLVGKYLAVSHPPGYPLLTLIVRLFSLGAGHDPNSLGGIGSCPYLALPFRLNLIAGLAAAGSCVVAYFIVVELSHDRLAGLFSALLWGVSFELWQQATALEVYSFQVLLLSVLLLAIIKWHSSEVPGPKSMVHNPQSPTPKWLLLAFFAFGLALANHTPIVLWIPSLLVLLWAAPARPGPRVLGLGVLLTALAVCLYLYVPLRASAPVGQFWTGINSLFDLFQFVSGRMYRYRLFGGGSNYLGGQVLSLPALFGKQFLAAWLLVIPGAIALWRSRRSLLVALLLGAAVVTFASAAYHIPDKEGYLLPAYFALLIVIGCGFALLFQRPQTASHKPQAEVPSLKLGAWSLRLAAAAVLVALPLVLFLPVQNRSRLHGLSDFSRAVLDPLPANSVLFTDDYSLFQGARWQQSIGGRRPDVLVVSQYYLAVPWYLDQLGRSAHVPDAAASIANRLWQNAGRMSDVRFGEAAKAASQQAMLLLVQDWLPARRVFWIPGNFSDWPQEWNGLRLTMRGLCYEIAARDTLPDLDSPLPPANRYRSTLYRDLETQDLCRRFAATACRRGIIRFATSANAEAVQDFNLALSYFPDYPQAIENKGIVFFFSSRPDSARFYLSRFLTLDPQSTEIPKVRQILAKLGS